MPWPSDASRLPAAVVETLGSYRAALDGVRRQGLIYPLSMDEMGRMFGIGFALDQFRRNLDDLAERAKELAVGRDHGTE